MRRATNVLTDLAASVGRAWWSLSDAVQYWVDETNPGTSPYFTSTEAGAAGAARRGWRRIIPKHHHAPAAQVGANASAAVENVYREDDVEGCFSEYLPAFNRDTLVAAVQDGFMNPATRALHAPLRAYIACDQSSIVHTCCRWIPVLKGFRKPPRSGAKIASRMSGNPVATS